MDIVLLQEQHKNFTNFLDPEYFMVREGRAAVVYRRHRHGLSITRSKRYSHSTPNLSVCAVTISFQHDQSATPSTITICSVYRSSTSTPPQHSVDEAADWLRSTLADFADGSRSLIIGGDLNACHPSWAGPLMPTRRDSRTATGELIHQIVSGHPHARILTWIRHSPPLWRQPSLLAHQSTRD